MWKLTTYSVKGVPTTKHYKTYKAARSQAGKFEAQTNRTGLIDLYGAMAPVWDITETRKK